MPKSKNKRKNGQKAQAKPSQSFANLVAEATDKALKNTIGQEIQRLGFRLAQNQSRELAGIVTRLAALEQLVCEQFNIDESVLATKVADIEDKATGYENITEGNSEVGDLLRLTIQTKPSGNEEYGPEAKIQVTSLNSGAFTLPKEIEENLVGFAAGQTVELPFGKEGEHKAKVTIDRISRKIQEETNEEVESTEE